MKPLDATHTTILDIAVDVDRYEQDAYGREDYIGQALRLFRTSKRQIMMWTRVRMGANLEGGQGTRLEDIE